MKLSEAIREGIGDTEQAIGILCTVKGERVKLCVLGAALNTIRPRFWLMNRERSYCKQDFLYTVWPELGWADPEHPEYIDLWDYISFLNDELRWTREQVADYLKSRGY